MDGLGRAREGGGGLPAALDGERRWGIQLGARSAPAARPLALEGSGSGGVFFVASLIGSSSLTPWRGGEAEAVGRGRTQEARWGSLLLFHVRRGRENELRGRSVRTTSPR